MANGKQIQYTIQGGNLPVGITMEPNSGALMGNLSPENVGQGPIWNSPADGSVLGVVSVGDNASFNAISVSPREGKTIIGIGVVGQSPLPWGLNMNGKTGAITGKVAELKGEQLKQVTNTNPPVWNTQFGTLGSFSESATLNLSIKATAQSGKTIKGYTIISGGMPWGAVLEPRNGGITGSVAELRAPGFDLGLSPTITTPPLWTTAPGTLIVLNENDTVAASPIVISVAATGQTGKTIANYRVTDGLLPWGLTINSKTGVISGTAAEVKLVTDPIFYDRTKDPVIGPQVTVNGANLNLAGDGLSIGSFAKGATVTAQFSISPYAGRTARAHIMSGSLPTGLKMDSTGKITGTIATTKYVQSGIYNFIVRAVDNTQAYSLRAYSLTVQ